MDSGQLSQLFEQGGPLAYLVALVGGVGLAFSLGVLGVLASGGRTAARLLATLALLCSALAVSVGVAGTLIAQSRVDESLGTKLSASVRERARRIGFSEARACAKLGLAFALVPALFGAIGLVGGRPRRPQQMGLTRPGVRAGNPAVGRLGAVLLLVTAGLASYAATLQRLPLPGRNLDEAGWQVLGLYDALSSNGVDAACLRPEVEPPADNSVAQELLALQQDCADKLISQLDEAGDPAAVAKAKDRLITFSSSRWLQNPEVRARVEARLKSGSPGKPSSPDPVTATTTTATATEPAPESTATVDAASEQTLPQALVRSVVSRQSSGIKRCYRAATSRRRKLSGELRVELVVGPNGHVVSASEAGGNVSDSRFRSCLLGEVKRLRFPADKTRGEAKVVYPFVF